MKFTERFLLILSAIGFACFFFLVPGGSYLLMVALSLLAGFYFFLGIFFFPGVRLRDVFRGGLKEVTGGMMVVGFLSGWILSVLAIGILFRLLDFPGADRMLIIGMPVSLVVLGIATIYSRPPRKSLTKVTFSRLFFGLALSIVVFMMDPITLAKVQYRNHPLYIQAYMNYRTAPQSPELRKRLDLERKRIVLSKEEFEVYEKAMGDKR